ncbi:hypothetical protein N9V84_09675 [Verrucomicrobiales bacterium]|nr:hypothetical protein [Verrucomicrobiales bacterium]
MIELSVAIECAITAAKRTLEMSGELEIDLSGDTPILGAEAVFDSMGFINFIISLEEELEQASGKNDCDQ